MFSMMYLDRLKSIYLNLSKPKSNILVRLKKKEFKPHELAMMTHQEMEPEKWSILIDSKIKRDKNATTVDMSAATDQFRCFKCKKSKCTYYQ